MPDRLELVRCDQVLEQIERATPEMSWLQRSRVAGLTSKRFYNWRKQQKHMRFYTADKLLQAFDLGYLLSDGTIDIIEKPIKHTQEDQIRRVQKLNGNLTRDNRTLRASRYNYMRSARNWKRKALEAEARIAELIDVLDARLEAAPNPLPLPQNCTCKKFVKTIDTGDALR